MGTFQNFYDAKRCTGSNTSWITTPDYLVPPIPVQSFTWPTLDWTALTCSNGKSPTDVSNLNPSGVPSLCGNDFNIWLNSQVPPNVETTAAVITADATLSQTRPTQNDGASERLILGTVPGRGGEDRIVLSFDENALQSALFDTPVSDVYLLLTPDPDENSTAPRNKGGTCEMSLTVSPLSDEFAEGNGDLSAGDSGDGVGATWLCAEDRDIQDYRSQCLEKWSHPLVDRSEATNATQVASYPTPLAWNVTADINRGIHRLTIKRERNSRGCAGTSELRYYSREGAAEIADVSKSPRLLLIHTE